MRSAKPDYIDADPFAIPELDAQSERRLAEEDAFACKRFRAGVVNHHALASDLLAGFFRTLKRCRPDIERVIVLSPDHALGAETSVVTHRLAYRVSGREILADEASIDRLINTLSFAREQPVLFEREHGIGALVPFLAREFPDVKLVPIVLRRSATASERERLAAWVSNELRDAHAFVIVSSDMAHYLSASQATANDQKTKGAFAVGNATFFDQTNDDFTDNGKSISVAIRSLGKTVWHLLGEGISSDYAGSPAFTTSYVVGFWE